MKKSLNEKEIIQKKMVIDPFYYKNLDGLKKSPNSRNKLEKDAKSTSSSKGKQISYSNFSQHFNYSDPTKIVTPSKVSSVM